MTAFVLGATGFVGREVVRQLSVRGVKTIAHVRPDSQQLAQWQARFGELGARVDTTPWEVAAFAQTYRDVKPEQIYICIGTTRSKAKSEAIAGDIYEKIDLGLTQLTVEAARASEAQPRLVYLSSVGADRDARSAYLRARGKAEDAVMQSALPWIVARPSVITGERDESRIGESVAGAVGDSVLAVVGLLGGSRVRDRYRSTSPDVLASALIRLGEQPEANVIADGALLR